MIKNKTKSVYLQATGLSVCGHIRKNNQDAIYFDVGRIAVPAKQIGLFIVCDGLGGHQAGDVASQTAISVIVSTLSSGLSQAMVTDGRLDNSTLHRLIKTAVSNANAHIFQMAGEPDNANGRMGTTVSLALVHDAVAYTANVGDSRIYLLRQNQLTQKTVDHSLVAELARQGQIGPGEQVNHPRSNVLTRALGTASEVEVDQDEITLRSGDRLLLCSDGLWKAFPDEKMLGQLLASDSALEEIIQRVVAEALHRDGSDNISGVLVDVASRPSDLVQSTNGGGRSTAFRQGKPETPVRQEGYRLPA